MARELPSRTGGALSTAVRHVLRHVLMALRGLLTLDAFRRPASAAIWRG